MGVKVAVIGGGSTYTPELIEGLAGLLLLERLPGGIEVEEAGNQWMHAAPVTTC